jgi:hypothetical protein
VTALTNFPPSRMLFATSTDDEFSHSRYGRQAQDKH